MAALKGMDKKRADLEIPEILNMLNLTKQQDKKIREYSGGMKQRLLIGQALLDHPSILIFDEPTAGLDPKERIGIRNIISGFSEDRIVIFATHVVSDVEKAATEVLFLKDGLLLPAQKETQDWKDKKTSLEEVYLHFFGDEGMSL